MEITIEQINGISYKNIVTTGNQFRAFNSNISEIGTALTLALELSETKAYMLTRGLLSTVTSMQEYETDAKSVINWAKTGSSQNRQMVARAIRNDGGKSGNIFMVQCMSEMTKTEARAFMKDYFESGGDSKSITEWLAIVGSVMRKNQTKSPDTAGFIINWGGSVVDFVVEVAEDFADTVIEGVEAIADAVVNAGKSLVDLIGDAATWAVDKVSDLVSAMIEIGQSVGDILKAAWELGKAGLAKFVKALIAIGKEIGEVLVYAVTQTADLLKGIVDALFSAAVSLTKVLEWVGRQVASVISKIVQTLIDVGKSVLTILVSALEMGKSIIGSIVKALIKIGKSVGEILIVAVTRPGDLFKEIVRALNDIGNSISTLFNEVRNTVADGIKKMANALISIGKSIVEIINWGVNKAAEIIKDVIRGVIEAGKTVFDIFTDIATTAIGILKKVVQALFDIGRTVLNLIEDMVKLGIVFARKFITAITQIAGGLLKFAKEVLILTYKAAAGLVKSLLEAGLTVFEVLGTVVGASYLVFRRVINGIIKHLGPVGQIMDWVLTQVEDSVSDLYHDALLAIKYGKGKITDAIDWAVAKSEEALENVLKAWESTSQKLIDFYKHVAENLTAAFSDIFMKIGKLTVKLENSITYVLNFLEKDYFPGMRDFVKGVLDAGYEIATLFVNAANLTLSGFTEAISACLDYGVTLTDLLTETMKNPKDFLSNFLQAVETAGQTLSNIYKSVIVDTAEQFFEEVTIALEKLEKPAWDILNAVLEVSLGAVATAINILLSTIGGYRAMTTPEIDTAKLIYGSSLDYSRIFFAQDSVANKIIFGIQDWKREREDSRAFVTNSLINFDVDDGPLSPETMIHELCHVWQYEHSGSFYMAKAIFAQSQWGDGYEYGDKLGLENAINNNPTMSLNEVFETFNPEQQAKIIEDYYVKKHIDQVLESDYATWQPFQQLVYA